MEVWELAWKHVYSEYLAHCVDHTNKIIKSAWEKYQLELAAIPKEKQPVVLNLNVSDESDCSTEGECHS